MKAKQGIWARVVRPAKTLSIPSSAAPFVPQVNPTSWLNTEASLASTALALGAREVTPWSEAEENLLHDLPEVPPAAVAALHDLIRAGLDPLGDRLCTLRSPAERRKRGATYTPLEIVDAMLSWASAQGVPQRVVDPGAGSGRFLIRAASIFPHAALIGVELDPLAALLLRANLASAGLAGRAQVFLADYRSFSPGSIAAPTLYIGNPPYVRHHLLEPEWKAWLAAEAAGRGCRFSQLAGLHVHFFLATAVNAVPGDFGSFITSAEWLDVNYGKLVRDLLLSHLGGESITVIEPTAVVFPDAASTAAITNFRVGTLRRSVSFRRVQTPDGLISSSAGRAIVKERLRKAPRWSNLSRPASRTPTGHVELGELFRVHRGQVTGANRIWIAGPHCRFLPSSVLFPTVTKARDLLEAGLRLCDPSRLRKVVDLPADLSVLGDEARAAVELFIELARAAGGDKGYIARNRRAWWSVGLREPAPILATYMARRPPAFVRNLALARHINIAHGLYPRESLNAGQLDFVAKYLSERTSIAGGRTYAGGLTKFEPREMERIHIPGPHLLAELA